MKIEIKEPCSENWENMKIGLISRHCDSCKKDVMDFTQKSREEIIIFLLSNPNESVCGRMNRSQFDFHHDDIPILIEALKSRPSNSSFLILSLVCLSLVACSTENSSRLKDKQNSNQIDTTEQTTMGISIVNDDESNKNKTHSKQEIQEKQEIPTLGEPAITEGEVAIVIEEPQVAGGISISESPDENSPLKFAEKMPEYIGGLDSLFAFINRNINKPSDDIVGTVYARITVLEDGKVSNPTILRSIPDHSSFDKEVLRVIRLMPNWIPGENKGQKVAVEYTLPFRFK
jgi:TonB family protein